MAYDFNIKFQRLLVAKLLQDRSTLPRVRRALDPEHFTDLKLRQVVDLLIKVWEGERVVPGPVVLKELIGEEDELWQTIQELYSIDVSDGEIAIKQAVDFATHQAIASALLHSAELNEEGEYERVGQEILEAVSMGRNGRYDPYDYFASMLDRIRSYGAEVGHKVPTGIGHLDRALDGGLEVGELGVILAPPGHGKTLVLVNFGAAAISLGYKVVHYTLEIHEKNVAKRYDMCLTGMNKHQIRSRKRSAASHLIKLSRRVRRSLFIKEFGAGDLTIGSLTAHLQYLIESHNFAPDLILIDYADLMRSDRQYEQKRFELKAIYEGLRTVGGKMGTPVWTASQTNRESLGMHLITPDKVAECWQIIAVADVVLTLNRTSHEALAGMARLYGAKMRENPDGEIFACRMDPSICLIAPALEEEEDDDDP